MDWDEAALWRTFSRYGAVVDVYIAKKLNRLKKRFGFARFLRVQDVAAFEKHLNGICIGAQKISVNIARFDRQEARNKPLTPPPPPPTRLVNSHVAAQKRYKSFADAVRGAEPGHTEVVEGKEINERAEEGKKSKERVIKLLSTTESRDYMQNTLVGEVESFQALMNVKAFQEVEGCPKIFMRYLGGLKMLLEFTNVKEKEDFLINGEEIWKPWFKKLDPWSIGCNFNDRIASLIIHRVPQHAWCEEAFSIIASTWGKVVIPEECITDSPNLAFGRVGIITSHPGLIDTAITIMVDGRPFVINIMEDLFESLKLSPVLATNDYYPNTTWWNEADSCDNISSNGESAMQSDDDEATPVTSPVSTDRRHDLKNCREDEETHVSNSFTVPEKVARILNADDRSREHEATKSLFLWSTYPGTSSPLGQNSCWARNSSIKQISRSRPTKSLDLNHVPSQSTSPLQSKISGDDSRSLSAAQRKNPLLSPSSRNSFSNPCEDGPNEVRQAQTQSGDSNSTTLEIVKTIEVGEKLGFQVRNSAEQLRKMIKARGVTIVDQ
ncbi:uncharacterized protein LOC128128921 [Lactuca sativa]|uniref:RRM domain-containing protein n=1 Tax=Lactuca sativa TaxID=4236 RepID=A0A9R1UJY2_LACSA|nr:uncharacterized protein LOC128128921 [Lactuca sativa]KAJ0188840.1 hypothetical protein LSAT_V11C900469040 [Lactuca sativa]